MKRNNLSYLFVAGALALASCSHDEYTGPDLAGSRLIVNGTVNENITRAGNSSWEPGDEIGISSDGGHDNVHFTTSRGDGSFESETPTYILGSGETSFTSYYPHHTEASANTPELTFTEPKDFMYATATASRENPVANFNFNHVMSKISMDITDVNAVDDLTGTIKLDGIPVSGKFHTLTGEVTTDNTKGNITKEFIPNSSVDFILPPLSQSSGPITVLINYNGKTYGGTLSLSELASGTEYHFSTALNAASEAGQLSISSASISDWNKNEGGNVEMEEKEPEREENILEIGDYLLADGTTLDRNDATLNQYKDKIVGVVYFVGNPQPSSLYSYTSDQDILLNNVPSATHGLAIALKDANNGAAARVAKAKFSFDDWFKDETNSQSAKFIGGNLNLTKVGTQMLGYNNTQVMIAASNDKGVDTTGLEDFINLINDYNNSNSVTNASSWYLPSYSELSLIVANYTTVAASIVKAGGDLNIYTEFAKDNANETFYWTSDLRGTTYNWATPLMEVEDPNANLYVNRTSNSNKGYFRLSIAF